MAVLEKPRTIMNDRDMRPSRLAEMQSEAENAGCIFVEGAKGWNFEIAREAILSFPVATKGDAIIAATQYVRAQSSDKRGRSWWRD